ncbi:GNAT family N-acetyltransferase [Gorillibacterium timonense]|uniref:GNAT family N-acetyltransferase n=1 Tax=Gorillibacterium timonense TaxID=1689269 RepID=UPI00071DF414|nr:GNAT family N-acetyltransferase [Gorillibacterium timonense]
MATLVPMDEEDYQHYLEHAAKDYALEKVRSGAWTEDEALKRSEEAFQSLLPDGMATADTLLFRIEDAEKAEKVGYLWLHERNSPTGRAFFIYDFLIFEPSQGKGYGKQAMAALDEKAKELGIAQISLHVFGHNTRAIRLYEKSGYKVTDLSMSKAL